MRSVLSRLPLQHSTSSEQATEELGAGLARDLVGASPRSMVLLEGDLGAGKTAFARGMGAGLGVPGTVNSPTFNLLNRYEGSRGVFLHYDLYRLSVPAQVEGAGFVELWHEIPHRATVHAVEWWQRAGRWLPAFAPCVRVCLSYDPDFEDGERLIDIGYVHLPHH